MSTVLTPPPIVDGATRRQFLEMLAAAGLLTGCSSGGTAPAPQERSRTIEHVLGATEITGIPERVVILDDAMLGYLKPLDIEPVGFAANVEGSAFAALYGFDDIPNVAPGYEPNLEAVAAARPDVIIALSETEVYDRLSAIAPTIALNNDAGQPGPDGPWFTEVFRTICSALGRDGAYAGQVERYTRRRDEIAKRHAATIARFNQVSLCRFQDGTATFRIDGPGGFSGAILADVGFTRPQAQLDVIAAESKSSDAAAADFFPNPDVSFERIALAEGDFLVVPHDGEFAELGNDPLLTGLDVVRSGRVFPVGLTRWFARSITGAPLVLDDLDQILTRLGE